MPFEGARRSRPAGGHFGIHITLLEHLLAQMKVTKAKCLNTSEPNASARKFGYDVKVPTRRV